MPRTGTDLDRYIADSALTHDRLRGVRHDYHSDDEQVWNDEVARPGYEDYYHAPICDLCLYELVFVYGEEPQNYVPYTGQDTGPERGECFQCYRPVAVTEWVDTLTVG